MQRSKETGTSRELHSPAIPIVPSLLFTCTAQPANAAADDNNVHLILCSCSCAASGACTGSGGGGEASAVQPTRMQAASLLRLFCGSRSSDLMRVSPGSVYPGRRHASCGRLQHCAAHCAVECSNQNLCDLARLVVRNNGFASGQIVAAANPACPL